MLFQNEPLLQVPATRVMIGLSRESILDKDDLDILSKMLAALQLKPGMTRYFMSDLDAGAKYPVFEEPLTLIFPPFSQGKEDPEKTTQGEMVRILLPSLRMIRENETIKRSVWKEIKTFSLA
jgi:hypothetical protein